MKERIAIVDGVRTPMCKAGAELSSITADDLGARVVSELLARSPLPASDVSELIVGNVSQPVHAANVARVIGLKAGLPETIPAFTVHRNCASGAEALTTAADKILAGMTDVVIVAGTESMSNIPLIVGRQMTTLFARLARCRTLSQRLRVLCMFRPWHLRPVIGVVQGLTDPVSGLMMGDTAEVLAREFQISRDEQDRYALLSHQRAVEAVKSGRLAEEIVPVPLPDEYVQLQRVDTIPRPEQSLAQLARLRPYFDRQNGTVTVGNSCALTDGAAALLVMKESRARELGCNVIGYLRSYAYAGLEPARMGLGPVYATSRLLDHAGVSMRDIELIELNEAFAAQVVANERAFASPAFAKRHLGRTKALGEIERDRLNVNGGAIALGHPVGMTGTRLVLTLLKEMRRRGCQMGLATMCIGGGQGGALLLEVA